MYFPIILSSLSTNVMVPNFGISLIVNGPNHFSIPSGFFSFSYFLLKPCHPCSIDCFPHYVIDQNFISSEIPKLGTMTLVDKDDKIIGKYIVLVFLLCQWNMYYIK
jgi:hypothetical protein